ncbi:MAG: LysM peptidoglycan-binding domain-containing protein [Candidatus Marinimicrobia bacterium]|nr:LysM peptidoglycan-binding domain-containing protein [Candidatus Neomarinimicrobiota bacterium]
MNRKFFVIILAFFLIFGCSKEVVEKEPITEEKIQVRPPEEEIAEQPPVETEVAEPMPIEEQVEEPVVETEEVLQEVSEIVGEVTVEEEKPAVDTLKQVGGQLEEVLQIVAEGDSIDIFYMVKPNDWLSKIALNEYGKISMWKAIYRWNRKKIGDNPNLIYPFHEFLLKKPKEIANPVEYNLYEYTVKHDESLWSIAGKEYSNNYAWIVILRDNADVLGSNLQNIPAGTVLELRTKLF